MALVVADRVQETTSTTGTGTLTLTGAVASFQSFSPIGNGNTTYYTITSGTDWEVGIGTYTASGTTLSRDTVYASSAGGTTKISVVSGAKVFCGYPASKAIYFPADGSSVAIGNQAGISGQGSNAIAIGAYAGQTNQTAGSVVINASGAALNSSNAGLYVNPVRNDTGSTTNPVYFNTTSKELTYGPAGVTSVSGTGTVSGLTLTGTVTSSGNLTLGGAITGFATSGANTNLTSVVLTTGTISTAPSSSTDIVNKSYADSIASGVNFHAACQYATAAALATNTYNNGASGVGATLTAVLNGALVIDGYTFTTPDIGIRVLIKNEVTQANNGVYTVTAVGGVSAVYVLTRATDYDTSGSGTNEVDQGDLLLVINGTANANTSWVQQTPLPITIGTTALVFLQFAAVQTYTAGTGLTLATNQFSITNTGTAGTYGSASLIPVITTNAQGQVTGVTTAANPQGTVTSVGFTGGLLSIATATTTPAITVAGTSGGVPYFSSASTWATSAALAANALVVGGGAGVAPATITTGANVLTALGVAVGSAGAVVVNGGVLGTPSSGTVTNLTGTASININGTVGATTPTTGAFTTITQSAGTATVAPILLTAGTNLTTTVDGAIEFDGTAPYFSVAASTRGAIVTEQWVVLTGTNTLTSQTGVQPIFDGGGGPTNGAVTLPIGTYTFECMFALTGMSGTSGSFGFGLAGGATKTFSYQSTSSKTGTSLATAMTTNQVFGTAANTALQTATAGTVGTALIKGIIRVTIAGTVIPQVSLTIAAAAVIQTNSYFRVSPIGGATVAQLGNWS